MQLNIKGIKSGNPPISTSTSLFRVIPLSSKIFGTPTPPPHPQGDSVFEGPTPFQLCPQFCYISLLVSLISSTFLLTTHSNFSVLNFKLGVQTDNPLA